MPVLYCVGLLKYGLGIHSKTTRNGQQLNATTDLHKTIDGEFVSRPSNIENSIQQQSEVGHYGHVHSNLMCWKPMYSS